MELSGNTILVSGGGSGIGLALVERFLAHGNTVIICGRRESVLKSAKDRFPALNTLTCDLSVEAEREKLAREVVSQFPSLNVLVNNAGVQTAIDFAALEANEFLIQREVDTNVTSPIALAALLLPHLMKRKSAIINITSALAFCPKAYVPVYSATKAALHSFSVSLRHQLKGSSVSVIEIAPPRVDTDLGFTDEKDADKERPPGISTSEFADDAFAQLADGREEILVGLAAMLRENGERVFNKINPPR